MAKASLTPSEQRQQFGRAIARCFALAGLSQKEVAGLIDRDHAQIARWVSGAERPQIDTLFAVAQFRRPLIIALAELAGTDVDIATVITVRSA